MPAVHEDGFCSTSSFTQAPRSELSRDPSRATDKKSIIATSTYLNKMHERKYHFNSNTSCDSIDVPHRTNRTCLIYVTLARLVLFFDIRHSLIIARSIPTSQRKEQEKSKAKPMRDIIKPYSTKPRSRQKTPHLLRNLTHRPIASTVPIPHPCPDPHLPYPAPWAQHPTSSPSPSTPQHLV